MPQQQPEAKVKRLLQKVAKSAVAARPLGLVKDGPPGLASDPIRAFAKTAPPEEEVITLDECCLHC